MNIEKLNDELAKASKEKAEKELERMIDIHKSAVIKDTNNIKYYLQQLATVPGKTADYNGVNDSRMSSLITNTIALDILLNLKKDLE